MKNLENLKADLCNLRSVNGELFAEIESQAALDENFDLTFEWLEKKNPRLLKKIKDSAPVIYKQLESRYIDLNKHLLQ